MILQLKPTLLVQLALVEFDKRAEERLLFARQWLRHSGRRVQGKCKASTGFRPPGTEFGTREVERLHNKAKEVEWDKRLFYSKQCIIAPRRIQQVAVVLVAGRLVSALRYSVGSSEIRWQSAMTASVRTSTTKCTCASEHPAYTGLL